MNTGTIGTHVAPWNPWELSAEAAWGNKAQRAAAEHVLLGRTTCGSGKAHVVLASTLYDSR